MAPTRHPDPEAAIQAALADYTEATADAVAALTVRLDAAEQRLVRQIARIVQTYEADRAVLASIRELTRG